MSLPLEGIRILDLSMYLPGPFCTQILADFGAEVIKIEELSGEWGRKLYPVIGDKSAIFYAVNRGKKSVAINLKSETGKEIFLRLAQHADVIVEQFRPGVMERLGLGYETLSKINPRLIYCSISGYGHSGPLQYAAGHDLNYLSLAGVTSLTGTRNQPGMSGVQIADIAGGSLQAVSAILLALLAREKIGRGQYCDIAMLDGAISLLAYSLAEWSGLGRLPLCNGEFITGGYACYQIYATADGKYVSLGAVEAKFWQRFCERIGRPEYIPYQWDSTRQEEILADIRAIMAGRTQQEWVDYFADEDICFTPVLNLEEMIQHPQVRDRNMVIIMEDVQGSGKNMVLTGCAIKLSHTPAVVKPVFPEIGEHTEAILQEIGYSREEIIRWKEEKILA
ncbi:MAG TPA: CaiB/BaiF CoA-transferase family protein [Syntrophomonadaceae bacterium]|nr:CaiB/BaiF CoA-transferase family protein [Syntrophomonadaceae bacterium]HPU49081.1 CaiB/BaiF CoA-transferase family protein [Syntrophomonadaceae bacterium]